MLNGISKRSRTSHSFPAHQLQGMLLCLLISSLTTRLVSHKIAICSKSRTGGCSQASWATISLQLISKRARVNVFSALCHNDMKSHQKHFGSFSNAFWEQQQKETASMNVENKMEKAVYCSVLHDWELQEGLLMVFSFFVALSTLGLAGALFSFAYLLRYLFHCSLLQRIAQEWFDEF